MLDSWKIVRVSEDFRVIALGLPVPKYKGNPLDPPLRSRFQARNISYLPFKVCTHYLFFLKPHHHILIDATEAFETFVFHHLYLGIFCRSSMDDFLELCCKKIANSFHSLLSDFFFLSEPPYLLLFFFL